MFDTRDILGFLFLFTGLFLATNMSLVSENPKTLTNLADEKFKFLVPVTTELDESLESSVLLVEFAKLSKKELETPYTISEPLPTRHRRAQKLVLNGN